MISVDISEVLALATELRAAGPKVVVEATQTLDRVRDDAGDMAQANAPRDTGALANSREDFGSGLDVGFGFTAPYALFVEFGTYKDRPQPYAFPAADIAEQRLQDEFADIGDPFD